MAGYYNTFVVKVWCNEADETLRGYIQHVSSQERVYFNNLEDVNQFMKSHLKSPFSDMTDNGNIEKWAIMTDTFGDIG
jgi:hypothetical protein